MHTSSCNNVAKLLIITLLMNVNTLTQMWLAHQKQDQKFPPSIFFRLLALDIRFLCLNALLNIISVVFRSLKPLNMRRGESVHTQCPYSSISNSGDHTTTLYFDTIFFFKLILNYVRKCSLIKCSLTWEGHVQCYVCTRCLLDCTHKNQIIAIVV